MHIYLFENYLKIQFFYSGRLTIQRIQKSFVYWNPYLNFQKHPLHKKSLSKTNYEIAKCSQRPTGTK